MIKIVIRKLILAVSGLAIALMLYPGSALAAGWRFPIGLSFLSGYHKIVNLHEDNLRAEEGFVESANGMPVGLSFQPYFELDSGLGWGGGVGPVMIILGDTDYLNVPVNATLRFAFLPHAPASPYVLAGLRYNIASGEYVEGSRPGVFAGAGVELMRRNAISLGLEVTLDTSEVEFERIRRFREDDTEWIRPGTLMLSLYAIF